MQSYESYYLVFIIATYKNNTPINTRIAVDHLHIELL